MPRPPASIAVLNYDGGDLVVRSVRSALEQDLVGVEVVVVDNGSTDGSLERLREAFPEIRVVENGENLGYARGMDVGFDATDGDLFVPLNCDAVLHPSFVRRALSLLDAWPQVAAVAPLVVRLEPGDPCPWEDGAPAVSWLDGGPVDLLPNMSVHPATDLRSPRVCFKPNGAAPALRRRALDAVVARFGTGPYDPAFETYGEDIDLAFKLWTLGWATRYEPAVLAGHVRSYASQASVFDKRGRLRVLLLASRHLNAWRHLAGPRLAFAACAVLAGDVFLALRGLVRDDPTARRDVWQAWRRVWAHRSSILEHRREHPRDAALPAGVFVWGSPRRRRHPVPPALLRG